MMRASLSARNKLKALERFMGRAYRDQAGIWTIGYGFIKGVKEGDTMTLAEADARFVLELAPVEAAVNRAIGDAPTTQNQFDAMVLLAYNIGDSGFAKSTVCKAHVRGDHLAAQRAFSLWNKVTDPNTGKLVVSRGLTTRRNEEAALYGTPDANGEPVAPIPQVVAPETSLAKSPIMLTSTGTAAVTTGLGVLSETTGAVRTIRENLGDALVPVLVIVVVLLCGYIAYWRWKQKQQGYT